MPLTDVVFLVTGIRSNESVRTTPVLVKVQTLVAITGNLINAVRLAATAASRGDNEVETIEEDTIMDPDGAGPGFVQTAGVVERDGDTTAFRAFGIGAESGPALRGFVCMDSSVDTRLEKESVVGGGSRHGAHKGGPSCEEGDGLLGKVHLFKILY